jgi:hypothetical protein
MTQALYAHMSNKRKKKRKCIYTQWNFAQPQRKMKFYHSQVNEWNWRTSEHHLK